MSVVGQLVDVVGQLMDTSSDATEARLSTSVVILDEDPRAVRASAVQFIEGRDVVVLGMNIDWDLPTFVLASCYE